MAAVSASLDAISKADAAMSQWVIAAGLKLIVVPIDSTWMRRSLASGSRAALPTPAEPERVAPASASRSGPVPRVGAPNGAGNSAVSYWGRSGSSALLFRLGIARVDFCCASRSASLAVPELTRSTLTPAKPRSIRAVSAPFLWLSLRDWRLAVGSGLVPSIPVFRSVRDYSRRAQCSTVPMLG